MLKKRRGWLAAVLNFPCPGLGFIYAGSLKKAFFVFCLPLFILALLALSRIIITPIGLYTFIALLLVLLVYAVIASYRLAKRNSPAQLKYYQRWYVYIAVICLLFVLTSVISTPGFRETWLGYGNYSVSSNSMLNTLQPGDYFLTNTWAYKKDNPKRGDLLVFKYPKNPDTIFIKRIIGLPGDHIQLKAGELYINGMIAHEPYVDPQNNQIISKQYDIDIHLTKDQYFVLGDNRDNSNDSRQWGVVLRDHFIGKATYLWLSLNEKLDIVWQRIGLKL